VKIIDAVHEFILYKQSLGMTYKNRALKLTAFARFAGPVEIDSISPETVRRFLDGGRPATQDVRYIGYLSQNSRYRISSDVLPVCGPGQRFMRRTGRLYSLKPSLI
jgi:hypothetical protein